MLLQPIGASALQLLGLELFSVDLLLLRGQVRRRQSHHLPRRYVSRDDLVSKNLVVLHVIQEHLGLLYVALHVGIAADVRIQLTLQMQSNRFSFFLIRCVCVLQKLIEQLEDRAASVGQVSNILCYVFYACARALCTCCRKVFKLCLFVFGFGLLGGVLSGDSLPLRANLTRNFPRGGCLAECLAYLPNDLQQFHLLNQLLSGLRCGESSKRVAYFLFAAFLTQQLAKGLAQSRRRGHLHLQGQLTHGPTHLDD
mmetsp:Transcript_820/g.1825  ORF Transcript_820/g.1825 Transcript_820/m.1825 type:complete len:254 (+) Transcript_820:1311-2072(+)